MDLILLEPGNQDMISGTSVTMIDKDWRDPGLDFSKKCIELVSLHQGMQQQITTDVSNRARTSGRPIITEFTVVKYVDATSVKLYEYCLRAEPLGVGADKPTKIYIARNSGDKTANIITIQLRDAIISEIQFQTHPDDMPTEQFKINFTEIIWTYTVQENDMTRPGSITAGWSISHNRPLAGKFS